MTKVLHITSWYPNKSNPFEAIWIKKQIDALSPYVDEQSVFHIEVRPSKSLRYLKNTPKTGELKKQIIFEIPTKRWFIIELIHFMLLFWLLRVKKINKGYDIVNFHVAYPQLVYWKRLKKGVPQKVVISEHWSAYHFNFGLSKKKTKIQGIFHHNLPLITVSNALARDIEQYADTKLDYDVVPNVIDTSIFYNDPKTERENYFFMVSQWKEPKNPFIAIKAFHEFNKEHINFKLKIAGFGPQLSEMKKLVTSLDNENIEFLGTLKSEEIADQMRKCRAFIHPSKYETFSVVCAEARACGTPSIASNVGGIPEVLDDRAFLINDFDTKKWSKAMHEALELKNPTENHNFSATSVGQKYFEVLNK